MNKETNNTVNYKLQNNDYLDLWKYFSDDAAKVKDKLWTIAIWLFAVMGSVLGYIAKNLDTTIPSFSQPLLIGVVSGSGLALSIYSYWMINSYGSHIRTSWNRTDYLRRQIEGLDEIWKQGYANYPNEEHIKPEATVKAVEKAYSKTNNIPSFVKRIRWMTIGFGLVFGGIIVLSLIQLIITHN